MQRAGVFVGVRRTGDLPELRDAVESARRMHAWALTQGMVDAESAVLVTDEGGPVTPDLLCEVIERAITDVQPEQLLIYFAGHGVTLRRGEQWLLSKAPGNPNHAVDVGWSIDAASAGTVPHVVFISDACRTAPEGIGAQQVQGGSIIPNVQTADQRFVDIYYACALGRPAAEIQDQSASAKSYRAVFTEVLLEVLNGTYDAAFEHIPPTDRAWYAEARRVRDVLALQVPKKIRAKRLTVRYGQSPQAKILSDPGAWLARLETLPGAAPAAPPAPPRPSRPPLEVESPSRRPGRARGGPPRPSGPAPARERRLWTAGRSAPERATAAAVRRTARALAGPFGPDHFESRCGIKVRGGVIRDVVVASGLSVEQLSPDIVRVHPGTTRGATALVRLGSGDVTVVPVVADHLTGLTVDEDELISVELEPSTNSSRWPDYRQRESDIRRLRAQAAAASAFGRFEPDREDFDTIASEMQFAKSADPALAIYAAYAFYERGDVGRVAGMADFLHADLGVRFYDLELLARHLAGRFPGRDSGVLPATPLLSQGWSLAMSHGVHLPEALREIQRTARDSLWSLYRPEAHDFFARALTTGEIR